MGRKEALPTVPPEPAGEAAAGANAPTPSRKNSKAGKKRTAAGMKLGRDDSAAQEVAAEPLERRKKPRVQQHKETQKLHLEKSRAERKHEHSQESNNLQQTGEQVQEQHLHIQQVKKQQHTLSHSCKRQDLLVDERGEDTFVTDDDVLACRTPSKPIETTTELPRALPDAAVGAPHSSEGAPKVDRAAAIDARAAADPYLLEDADYLRRETRWLNRQRVLLLGSRGISARSRHLIEDFKKLLPHHKLETKWEKKERLQNIAELCQLRSCNSVVYLEQRKNDALLHVVKVPLGPTFIARLMNVETLNEVRLSGNCLLHSRPLLVFGAEFEREPHLRVLKELFMQGIRVEYSGRRLLVQVFGTPRNHPKSKPFFDHAMSFFVTDSRIWFRHYQLMRPRRLREVLDFAKRQGQKEKRRLYLESMLDGEPRNKLAKEVVFGTDVVKQQSN